MAGGVRVGVAWDDGPLVASPTWQYLTDDDNLVAGYDIDRGNPSEFDRTGGTDVTVTIWDQQGLLDPTNSAGVFYNKIEPGVQIKIDLRNPCRIGETDEWETRFRGWIDEYNYDVQPFVHQVGSGATVGVTALSLECIGIRELLDRIEMQPGEFGDTPPKGAEGQVFFDNASAHDRITQVFTNAGIPSDFVVVFSLNVDMQESSYSPSESCNQPIQDAADAEFPTVSNAYPDRLGRYCVHGREAKFDPATVAAGAGSSAWDFHHWKAGDEHAVRLSISDTAQLRELSYNRGWKFVRNSAFCTPNGILDTDVPGQYVKDTVSIGQFGYGSWSAENLLIDSGVTTGNTANEECLMFANYVIANYAEPRNRITNIAFKSMRPEDTRAAANWQLLTKLDISDLIDVSVRGPGDSSSAYIFNAEPFFVEGVRETATPLTPEYAMVTLNLDLSPQAYFTVGLGA